MFRSHILNKGGGFSVGRDPSSYGKSRVARARSVRRRVEQALRGPFASAFRNSVGSTVDAVRSGVGRTGKHLVVLGQHSGVREMYSSLERFRGPVLAGAYILLYGLAILLIGLTDHDPASAEPTWDLFIPLVAIVCAFAGWRQFAGNTMQSHAIYLVRQTLHWGALLMVIHLLFLPAVQVFLKAETDGFIIIYLVGLTSMLAGVYLDWKMGLFGLFLVFSGVIVAFIDNNAMLIVVGGAALIAIIITALVWIRYNRHLERRMMQAQGGL
jgi:hypothetical protein